MQMEHSISMTHSWLCVLKLRKNANKVCSQMLHSFGNERLLVAPVSHLSKF